MALCKRIIQRADANCVANVDIDDESFDPDGDIPTIMRSPEAPYLVGNTQVTLTVRDEVFERQCTSTVTVINSPPQINTPYTQLVVYVDGAEVSPPNNGKLSVDAYDLEGHQLTYDWTTSCPLASFVDEGTATPTLVIPADTNPVPCQVSLKVTDACGSFTGPVSPYDRTMLPVSSFLVDFSSWQLFLKLQVNVFWIFIETPPVAMCKPELTLPADAYCSANVNINNGSYDLDRDRLRITQYPLAPYSIGSTSVTLTVDDGVFNRQCTTIVNVENIAPVLKRPLEDKTVLLGDSMQLSVEVDPDEQSPLTYFWDASDCPDGVALDDDSASTPTLSIAATTIPGPCLVSIKVCDACSACSLDDFMVSLSFCINRLSHLLRIFSHGFSLPLL